MTNAHHVIGLDLGTTGLKGVLVDRGGALVAEASVDTVFDLPQDGWVEVPAQRHLENVGGVIRRLAAAAGNSRVAALAMAGATGNTVLTDADGTPLTPIINWMDARCEVTASALAGLTVDEVRRVTGWPCINSFPLGHLAWLKDHQPEVYRSAAHVGMAADWLIHQLTGQWCMDHSTATTFHLQDQVKRAWYAPFLERFAIVPEQLSVLLRSGTLIAPLTAAAAARLGLTAETQVVAGCFDHPAAARAAGVLQPGQLMLSCGTSWVGFAPHGNRDELLAAGLLCDPFLADTGGPWGGIFSVPCIGRNVDWYIENVIAPDVAERHAVFNELAAQAAPGAGGLTIDLTTSPRPVDAGPANVARAVMEGAASLLAAKLDELRGRGFVYEQAVMVGGPSESELWTRILADKARLRLTRGGRSSGARGAAMLAGIGLGWYTNESDALNTWN